MSEQETIISRIKTMLYQIKNPRDRQFLIMDRETEIELKGSVYFPHYVSINLDKFMGMTMVVANGFTDEKILEIR